MSRAEAAALVVFAAVVFAAAAFAALVDRLRRRTAEPTLTVVTVPVLPDVARAIDLAQAAVERDRASLEPWLRELVERIEPEVEAAVARAVLYGHPSDDSR